LRRRSLANFLPETTGASVVNDSNIEKHDDDQKKHFVGHWKQSPKSLEVSFIGKVSFHRNTLVSCPRNKRYFVAIKMGRRQGGPSRTGGRRERVSIGCCRPSRSSRSFGSCFRAPLSLAIYDPRSRHSKSMAAIIANADLMACFRFFGLNDPPSSIRLNRSSWD
jgi:hypothetical protein